MLSGEILFIAIALCPLECGDGRSRDQARHAFPAGINAIMLAALVLAAGCVIPGIDGGNEVQETFIRTVTAAGVVAPGRMKTGGVRVDVHVRSGQRGETGTVGPLSIASRLR